MDTVIMVASGVALGIAVGALSNAHSIWETAGMAAAVLVVGAVFIRFLGAPARDGPCL